MKVIGETDCPHCKKSHEAEIDLGDLQLPKIEKSKVEVKEILNPTTAGQVQLQEQKPKEPEAKVILKTKVPSHIPKFKCKNCDKLHDNPDYKKLPRFKCKNCDQLNPTPQCEFCNNEDNDEFDELSDDDFENMGIKVPHIEHEHEHTEDD